MRDIEATKIGDTILNDLNIPWLSCIVLSEAGSSMYGTRTSTSDRDYLGIFMPTEKQLLLNDFPRQVSLPKDSGLDCQMWSIHYFLKLACQGETMALDLLHAPDDNLVAVDFDLWYELVGNRKKFYTKGMKSFVSYARKQAAKYGIKGTRIEALEKVIAFLDTKNRDWNIEKDDTIIKPYKLSEIWDDLPTGEHIHFINSKPYKMYQVAGKKFQETVYVHYIKEHLNKSLTEYGKRAMLARENKGVDWKAISHAIRCAEQVYDILEHGDYEYPLRNAEFITKVKKGELDFESVVQPILESDMNDVEVMMESSNLPDEVDKEYWNNWLFKLMREHVLWQT